MIESRLNNVMLLHTHKEIRDKIDVTDITDFFVSSNSRKAELF